jgi:hypothetical protein
MGTELEIKFKKHILQIVEFGELNHGKFLSKIAMLPMANYKPLLHNFTIGSIDQNLKYLI